jgi:hypothetical protein
MINVVEIVLMGILATLFMDLSGIFLAKLKVIRPKIGPEVVGRWFLYMFKLVSLITRTSAWGF